MDPSPNPALSSDDTIAILLAVYAIMIGFGVLLGLALYVLMSISLMGFFRKVGVSPGIAWVPYYSTWKWLEIGGQPGWLSLLSLTGIGSYVAAVFLYIGMYRTGLAFGKSGAFLVLGIFLPFVWAFILGGKTEVYRPEVLASFGYPPPLAGFGAVPMEQRAHHASQQAAGQQAPAQQPYTGA
jgi:hypothetical protein